MSDATLHELYEQHGPEMYYRLQGDLYRNPHEPAVAGAIAHAVAAWASPSRPEGIDFSHVLDLAAGGGEVSRALLREVPTVCLDAIDPYTHRLYEQRTGRPCRAVSFEDIVLGRYVLPGYSCIVCSCALHLLERSWLPGLCWALASSARDLLVITPITRPEIDPTWGLVLVESVSYSAEERSVRLRWYRRRGAPEQPAGRG
jgi:hypothetical protein